MSKLMIFSEALDVGGGGAQKCPFSATEKSSFFSLSDGDLNFSFFRKLAEGWHQLSGFCHWGEGNL